MKTLYFFVIIFILFAGCEKTSYYYSESIVGKWEWTGSCGGFTGGCWYPDKDNQLMAEFTSDNRYIRYSNGIKTFEIKYSLGKTYDNGGTKSYEIIFSTGWETVFWFVNQNTLDLPGGDFVEEFKRIN